MISLFHRRGKDIFLSCFQELGENQKRMALLLEEFSNGFREFESFSDRAKSIEHTADEITHKIIDHLNKTFITPFDREDIYLLANELDNIVDLIENVIHNFFIYSIIEKRLEVDDFARLIREASETLEQLILTLSHGNERQYLSERKIKLHELEDKADIIFQKAVSALFENENNPILVIKWKDIFEDLEHVMDTYQKISDTIEGIIVKSS